MGERLDVKRGLEVTFLPKNMVITTLKHTFAAFLTVAPIKTEKIAAVARRSALITQLLFLDLIL
jgi:hypothetical protein